MARRVGVIGAGAWGTALAQVAARAGHEVMLWARQDEVARAINETRENRSRLAGVPLEPAITATSSPIDLKPCDLILVATPAQSMREVLSGFRTHLRPGVPAVIAAKGIERTSSLFLVDVLADVGPDLEPLVLSGPSFASEVARGLPTAVTLAARHLDVARPVAESLSLPTFRPYVTDDLIGVQVGGASKNVLAIAAGIVTGRGLGESARAALIARAYAELARFGRALGARPETLAGLSGLGDLVLTCSSSTSRNFSLGRAIGRSEPVDAATHSQRGISEGAFTAEALVQIATQRRVDVPISAAVFGILQGQISVDAAIDALMQRPLKIED